MNPGAGDSGGDDNGSDSRKGAKRELSTSKRAAQNRAAQVCDSERFIDLDIFCCEIGSENVFPRFG